MGSLSSRLTLTDHFPRIQVYVNQDELLRLNKLGVPTLYCDGLTIIEGPSYEKIYECFGDDGFKHSIIPGQEKVADMARFKVIPVDILPFGRYSFDLPPLLGKAGT